jgi:hypothetical protein
MAGFCKHGYEPSGKFTDYLEKLSTSQGELIHAVILISTICDLTVVNSSWSKEQNETMWHMPPVLILTLPVS